VVAEGRDRTRSLAIKFCTATAARGEEHADTTVLASATVRRPNLVAVLVEDERGVVVTDFVDGAQGDVLTGCTAATALDIAGSIADLHATWWGRGHPDLPLLEERLRRPLTSEQVDRCLAEHRQALSAEAGAVLRTLPDRVDELADRFAQLPLTVVHGDLHLDNVLIDDSARATIVDWGRPRRAPAVVDVARCFVEVIDATPSDALGREFLDHYVERLGERGPAPPDEHSGTPSTSLDCCGRRV
jgi:Ser/Thr protein kinase RdoA (MazF antagonist)